MKPKALLRPFISRLKRSATPWRVRAVQLDLARQKETFDTIREFIVFARNWGYNTLVLYLEGVIHTKSFPYRSLNLSYQPDDIKRIVSTSEREGLNVIPVVATLGHAEHFIKCQHLQHLGETGSWCKNMFCPSNEGTYSFLKQYFADITPLFPSKYFHIGCDEAWALGSCPVCRLRIENGETKEDLLIAHILRIRRILNKFGKRVWIWDDMFENDSGSTIARLPRDIVMCSWHYDPEQMSFDGFQGHFNRRLCRDSLGIYKKLGFKVIVCPWARGSENTINITEVASKNRVLGGLQTIWELSSTFLPSVLPSVALAGALWAFPSHSIAKTVQRTLRRLFPSVSSLALDAIRGAIIEPFWEIQPPVYYLRGKMTLEEIRALNSFIIYEKIIREELESVPNCLERDILRELHIQLRLQIVAGRQRLLLPILIDPRTQDADRILQQKEALECIAELNSLANLRSRQWSVFRNGIKPDHASARLDDLSKELKAFTRNATSMASDSNRSLLNVRLFLWESYSAPWFKIELAYNGKWRQIYKDSLKPVNLRDLQYTLQVPIRGNGYDPQLLRFTVSGYGGQGIGYASIVFNNRTLIPSGIAKVNGFVDNPSALLSDDFSVCYLGSSDTVRTLNLHLENDPSSIEIVLRNK